MRDEDEKLLLTLLLALLAAQMARVLQHPEWGLQDDLPADAVGGVVTAIAAQEAWRIWLAHTILPPPANLFSQVGAWARQYCGQLVKGVDAITRSQLSMFIQSYVTEGWTMGELTEAIGTIFGEARAMRIAVTEVTRAYVEAARISADEMAALGLPMTEIWETDNDELVCEICAPRQGKVLGDGWTRDDGPPAHPNCRCRIRFEVA